LVRGARGEAICLGAEKDGVKILVCTVGRAILHEVEHNLKNNRMRARNRSNENCSSDTGEIEGVLKFV
jgi:hypothetical protein